MADDIPAGWYPDIHGTVRWWDGQRWTDHVRESGSSAAAPPATSAPAPEPSEAHAPEPAITESVHAEAALAASETAVLSSQAADAAPASLRAPAAPAASYGWQGTPPGAGSTATEQPIHHPTRTISYPKTVEEDIDEDDGGNRRIWLIATVVGLLAFFLGMGVGGRTHIDPPGTSEPIPPAAVNSDSTDIDQQRQQLEERQAELDERQQVLDDREAELDRRASATPSPTPTPSPTETATETEIDGNDRVLVGTDVREGTYRTNGPTDAQYECQYTISKDEFGDDKISDDSTKTSTSVTLRDGDWFESEDCQDWERE